MNRTAATVLLIAYTTVLLCIGTIRYQAASGGALSNLAPLATLLYIGAVAAFIATMPRVGLSPAGLGFRLPMRGLHLLLAITGVVLLQLLGTLLDPLLQQLFNDGRNLNRFAAVQASTAELVRFLLLSWTVAAIGEELAFRILLQRTIATLLGNTIAANSAAIIIQALVFGAVHAYQGPVGAVETFASGLVYGSITALARYAIWPAALAHGTGNTISLARLYMGV